MGVVAAAGDPSLRPLGAAGRVEGPGRWPLVEAGSATGPDSSAPAAVPTTPPPRPGSEVSAQLTAGPHSNAAPTPSDTAAPRTRAANGNAPITIPPTYQPLFLLVVVRAVASFFVTLPIFESVGLVTERLGGGGVSAAAGCGAVLSVRPGRTFVLLRTPTFASLVVAAAVLVARGAVECCFCFRGDRPPPRKRARQGGPSHQSRAVRAGRKRRARRARH